VVGYKPTFGMVNRVGVRMIADTLDTVGALGRTVPDVALLVAALTERHELMIDAPHPVSPRIGLCRTHEWDRAQPETAAMFDDTRRRLQDAGAHVRDLTLPQGFAGLADAQIAIMVHEVAKSLSYERIAHRDRLSAEMIAMIDAGLAVSPARYDEARTLARLCRAVLPEIFGDLDVLVAPSTMGEAPAGIDATGDPIFNRIWTLLHVPVVHVPVGLGPRGLPLGVTVVGPLAGDRATLLAAEWIHARLGGTRNGDR
jgi:Asp-tRNA(Asn)/Glu-tRNA(Gln) amidotransferase A subunit family amidase